jgi:hypothetical protein
MNLVVCGACQRHVKRGDSVCPFCGKSLTALLRPAPAGALALGIAVAMASCGNGNDASFATAYGPPPCDGGFCPASRLCVDYSALSSPCEPSEDGGCPAGLVSADSCVDPSSGATRTPGCTYAPLGARCVDSPPVPPYGYYTEAYLCASLCDGGAACKFGGSAGVTCTLK